MNESTTLEFNPIKTIRLINRDQLLQKVFSNKTGSYRFTPLLEAAEHDKLQPNEVLTLKNIHEHIILVSDSHKKLYEDMKIAPETPRRYGKVQIMADVKKQGGKATTLQETLVELGDLKAIVCTLSSRGVSDQFKGTNKLTEDKQRKIKAAIRDFKIKMAPILKSK